MLGVNCDTDAYQNFNGYANQHSHQYVHQYVDTDEYAYTDEYVNTDSNADVYQDVDKYTYKYVDANLHTNADANEYPNEYGYTVGDGYVDSHCDTNVNYDQYSHVFEFAPNGHSDRGTHADDTNTYSYEHTASNRYVYKDTDRNGDSHDSVVNGDINVVAKSHCDNSGQSATATIRG
jgi:hypothetical protein